MGTVYLSDSLVVIKRDDHMRFENDRYSMYLKLYYEDVNAFIDDPCKGYWGRRSSSNSIDREDEERIIKYLKQEVVKRKYETIEELMSSRCRITTKKKELDKFSTEELIKYIEKMKGEANDKVASCS